MFEAVSSAGLFDRLAKIVLDIVRVRSDMQERCTIQHLDDVCSASPKGSKRSKEFYSQFQVTCDQLGVQLAPPGDKDK